VLAITGSGNSINLQDNSTLMLGELGSVSLDSSNYYSFLIATSSSGTPVIGNNITIDRNSTAFAGYTGSLSLVANGGNVYLNASRFRSQRPSG
jgi:hypothetical protein